MKAKKKPVDTKPAAAYGVDTAPRLSVVEVREPAARKAGIKVADAQELVSKLKAVGAL
jgi:electron transfer flavoprotein beta subunit